MPRFKVGDAVRVKAGSPVFKSFCAPISSPDYLHFGRRWIISELSMCNAALDSTSNGRHWVSLQYLEPWNDTEEWNGTAWVAKKKSESKLCVIVRIGNVYAEHAGSINEAVKRAKQRANDDPGCEYIVYQEKARFKVDRLSKAEMLAEELRNVKEKRVQAKGEWYELDGIDVEVSGNVVTARYHVKT